MMKLQEKQPRDYVYCVVAINHNFKHDPQPGRHTRPWGWFPTMNEARRSVRSSARFIHECGYYQWCLIEQAPPGLCSDTRALEWYKLKGERFVKAKCPPWAKHICNWSLG